MSTSVTHGLDPAGGDTAADSPVIWYAYDLSPGFALSGDASDNGDTG